jgi:hypothetical protein
VRVGQTGIIGREGQAPSGPVTGPVNPPAPTPTVDLKPVLAAVAALEAQVSSLREHVAMLATVVNEREYTVDPGTKQDIVDIWSWVQTLVHAVGTKDFPVYKGKGRFLGRNIDIELKPEKG